MYSTNAFKKVIFYMDTNGHMTLTFFCVLLCVVAITFCAQARLFILPTSDVFDKTCLPQAHNSFLQDIEVYLFMRRQEKCFQTPPNSQAFFFFCGHKIRSISHSSLRKTKQSKRPKNSVWFFVKWLFTWSHYEQFRITL